MNVFFCKTKVMHDSLRLIYKRNQINTGVQVWLNQIKNKAAIGQTNKFWTMDESHIQLSIHKIQDKQY
jgi:hypothetical protein